MSTDQQKRKGLRMHQLVSVMVDGLSELCEIRAMNGDTYRVKIMGTRPAKVITVTRDEIKD